MSTNVKPKILKKITTRDALEDTNFKALETTTPVLRIAGLVRRAEQGEHAQYGPYYKFTGEFHATDLRTGQTSISSVCYLPSPVDQMLFEAANNGEGAGSVEFAFDISVKPRPDLQVGYEYVVETLLEAKASSPMDALLNKLGDVPALASPDEKPTKGAKKA